MSKESTNTGGTSCSSQSRQEVDESICECKVPFPILKLCDFNSSEITDCENEAGIIHGAEGDLFFRPPECYVPREELGNGGINGFKRDMFALGVVLYCMCFGEPPFGGFSGNSGIKGMSNFQLQMELRSAKANYPAWFVSEARHKMHTDHMGSKTMLFRNWANHLMVNLRSLLSKESENREYHPPFGKK